MYSSRHIQSAVNGKSRVSFRDLRRHGQEQVVLTFSSRLVLRYSLDYDCLNLQRFIPGATIRLDGAFHTISDPFREPLLALSGLFSPVGSLVDKLRVALLRMELLSIPLADILNPAAPHVSAADYLAKKGLSPDFVSAFFRPFYGGVFLFPLADQSAKMVQFLFRMFAEAPASLPARGIGAVAEQMRAALPTNVDIQLNTPASSVKPGQVQANEDKYSAPVVIVATEGPAAARLLGTQIRTPGSLSSICLYFTSDRPSPVTRPILVLNGNGECDGPVNNMFVPSQVAPAYAPQGKTLISTTIVGYGQGRSDDELENAVRVHMTKWFGREEVDQWSLLRVYRIPHALPAQSPDFDFNKGTSLGNGLFVCGDHRNSPTLHGAMLSGRLAASEALTQYLDVKV